MAKKLGFARILLLEIEILLIFLDHSEVIQLQKNSTSGLYIYDAQPNVNLFG